MSARRHFAAVVVVLLLALAAAGQQRAETRNWDISGWLSGATGEENTNSLAEAQVWQAGLFLGRALTGEVGRGLGRGSLEWGFNVIPVLVASRPRVIYGGGLEPVVLRWNFSQHTGRVRPYIELAGGALATTANLPAGNTSSFNFTARGGGGVYIGDGNRRSWDLGLRWLHISNANIGTKNPEFNGLELTFGYHWFK